MDSGTLINYFSMQSRRIFLDLTIHLLRGCLLNMNTICLSLRHRLIVVVVHLALVQVLGHDLVPPHGQELDHGVVQRRLVHLGVSISLSMRFFSSTFVNSYIN